MIRFLELGTKYAESFDKLKIKKQCTAEEKKTNNQILK